MRSSAPTSFHRPIAPPPPQPKENWWKQKWTAFKQHRNQDPLLLGEAEEELADILNRLEYYAGNLPENAQNEGINEDMLSVTRMLKEVVQQKQQYDQERDAYMKNPRAEMTTQPVVSEDMKDTISKLQQKVPKLPWKARLKGAFQDFGGQGF
jgi:chromosome segregation ATPase